jgi:hypothetical protein
MTELATAKICSRRSLRGSQAGFQRDEFPELNGDANFMG